MPELYDEVARKSYSLTGVNEIFIGRMVTEDHLRTVDTFPRVSKSHARVIRTDRSFYVEDLGSINGTWLDGKRLKSNKPELLNDKNRISLAGNKYYPIIFYGDKRPEPEKKDDLLDKEETGEKKELSNRQWFDMFIEGDE